MPEQKLKIPSVRVPSDACEVFVGREIRDGKIVQSGTPYRIHAGEWVEVLPVQTLAEHLALVDLISAAGSTEAPETRGGHLHDALDRLCMELSKRVLAWNWTDMTGEAMPQPHRNPALFRGLLNDELLWLVSATQGETAEQRKNGSTPSHDSSSASPAQSDSPARA